MSKPTSAPVVTTLAKYAGQSASGYSRMPTVDVPIIDPPATCVKCGKFAHLVRANSYMSRWAHTDDPTPDGTGSGHYVEVHARCSYCGTNEPDTVHYRQHPWHDAVECDRCGGVTGYAIGD